MSVQLALGISQTHMGEILVELQSKRKGKTVEVIAELRQQLNVAVAGLELEFVGILGGLIGDLTWSSRPIEIKLFSTDVECLKQKAPQIETRLKKPRVWLIRSMDGKPPAPR